jgi:LCP family protein required for cell wall assembly
VRFGLGALLIVVVTATATASAGLIFFEDVGDDLRPFPDPPEVKQREPGDPYTILLLGSDKRDGALAEDKRSDTTMLLRLDPSDGVLSLLSLPRDLSVVIPGYGQDKLNAAYSAGGPDLVLKTVSNLTDLDINEVIDVDFQGFADAVDAIECVYIDVDQDYLIPPGTGIAEIDINSGYQRLCGLKALQYVRYRHTDNDIVRGARQQAFLREARQKVDVSSLVLGGGGEALLDAFVDNTRSTIDGGGDVRDIARSLFDLRGASVNQVDVEGDLGGELGQDITATQDEVARAVDKFLGKSTGSEEGDGEPTSDGGDEKGGGKRGKDDGGSDEPESEELPPADPQVAKYAGTADRRLGFPVYYPTQLPGATRFSDDSRTYEYKDPDDDIERAYKLVLARPNPTITEEYFGMMGTTWEDPPILDSPSEVRTVDGREYLLFYAGDRLRLVGWKEDGNAYWISNSLLESLSENEMMAVATSVELAGSGDSGSG